MKRLWIALAIVVVYGFSVLGWIGSRIYQEMPPVPERVVTTDGQVVVPAGAIAAGQAVWQTMGGMEIGSISLVLIGHQAMKDWRTSRPAAWALKYRWPVHFFIAVAFWNLVGAGLFGFMINPPIALFYVQGLNTTPVHGHAALFGVYGMLGLGLTPICLRTLQADREWKEGLLAFSFWAMNIGLMAQIVLSLLPVGLLQTWASVQYGYWYARSGEFLDLGLLRTLRWLRVPGDTVFAIGAIAFVVFFFGLRFGYSVQSAAPGRIAPRPPAHGRDPDRRQHAGPDG